uniref:ATP synthase complex subunit 8 n=1 Tax=Nauphoeta cinerea TaxID=6990 RepID=A0A2P1H7H8_NAUCI|nr:ATP synthase F0 subunit 8 [Nauphoeta cinerea]ARS88097.1 ATP synthase F0 subunit 8 [Nauphoeta cinerea]AVN67478.1 ATP synthase F0 subunit 8 [Nauphoeta cinerea]
MPQMMPLSWFSLFLFFIAMLLIFSFINYYSYIHNPSTYMKSLSSSSLNWKW